MGLGGRTSESGEAGGESLGVERPFKRRLQNRFPDKELG